VTQLNASAGTCIIIDVTNVTLDCQGNSIIGNGSTIVVDLRTNYSEVINCNFFGFSGATDIIRINSANQTRIAFNNFTQTTLSGAGNVLTNTGKGTGLTIEHNYFDGINANLPILIINQNSTFFLNNTFGNIRNTILNQPPIIRFTGANGLIQNNSMNVTLELPSCKNWTISQNIWHDMDRNYPLQTVNAIKATTSSNISITHNQEIPLGIELRSIFPCNCNISNNNFTNNGRITLVSPGAGNSITQNRFVSVESDNGNSAGINLDSTALVQGNTFVNGRMASIVIDGNNSVIRDNLIENVTGDAYIVPGNNNTFINNTLNNFTGPCFRINGSRNKFFRNNVTYIVKLHNTSFNRNVSTPQVPIQYAAFLLDPNANSINISHNTVRAQNPNNLLNGLFGVRTRGNTYNSTIYNNTFTNLRMGTWIKDATLTGVFSNTFTDCTQRAIMVQNSSNTVVSNNVITAPSATLSTDPYTYAAGIYVYRHNRGTFASNNISNYQIGLFLNNAANNIFTNHNITGIRGIGIHSLYGINNSFTQFVITNQAVGVKAIYTNISNFTAVNVSTSRIGYQFYNSYSNYVGNSNTPGLLQGLELTHFSSNNTINNNNFAGSTDVDILFDLFATANTGAGNGVPTTRQENGAAGNVVV
jgi:parallel beta-helix repeat protein